MTDERPEPHDDLNRLMRAARCGDWDAVGRMTALIRSQSVPADGEGLSVYIRDLKEVLIVAKAARAHLMMASARLNAAVNFNAGQAPNPAGSGKILAVCHDPDA